MKGRRRGEIAFPGRRQTRTFATLGDGDVEPEADSKPLKKQKTAARSEDEGNDKKMDDDAQRNGGSATLTGGRPSYPEKQGAGEGGAEKEQMRNPHKSPAGSRQNSRESLPMPMTAVAKVTPNKNNGQSIPRTPSTPKGMIGAKLSRTPTKRSAPNTPQAAGSQLKGSNPSEMSKRNPGQGNESDGRIEEDIGRQPSEEFVQSQTLTQRVDNPAQVSKLFHTSGSDNPESGCHDMDGDRQTPRTNRRLDLEDEDDVRASLDDGKARSRENEDVGEDKNTEHGRTIVMQEGMVGKMVNLVNDKLQGIVRKELAALNDRTKHIENMVQSQEKVVTGLKNIVENMVTSVVMLAKGKDIKNSHDVVLYPLKEALGPERLRTYLSAVVVNDITVPLKGCREAINSRQVGSVRSFLDAVFYSRLPNEKKPEELDGCVLEHIQFRKKVILTAMNRLGKDKEAGVVSTVKEGVVQKTAKPFWLCTGFVRPRDVNRVLQTQFSQPKNISKDFKETKIVSTQADLQDAVLAEEIVRRINQLMTQILNKGREHARIHVFESFAFAILDESWDYFIDEYPNVSEGIDVSSIPNACTHPTTSTSRIPGSIVESNKKKWEELIEKTQESLSFVIRYEVDVETIMGKVVRKEIRREIHMMRVSLHFLMKITGHSKVEVFFTLMPTTYKCIFIVAKTFCDVFHDVIIHRMKGGSDPEGAKSRSEIFLSGMCPPSNESRKKTVQEKILRMSADAYHKEHIPASHGDGSGDCSVSAAPEVEMAESSGDQVEFDEFDHLG